MTECGAGANSGEKFSPHQDLFKTFGAISGGTFCVFFFMAVVMIYAFHNSMVEISTIMPIAFVTMIGLLAFMLYQQRSAFQGIFQKIGEISNKREVFAKLWLARNPSFELKYVSGRTSPEYFELSPSYNGDVSDNAGHNEDVSDSEESNDIF